MESKEDIFPCLDRVDAKLLQVPFIEEAVYRELMEIRL